MKRRMPADMNEMYSLRADTIDYFFPDRIKEIELWSDLASRYGDDVLHVMCGTGEITVGLADHGFNVTGLDMTTSMRYKAQERITDDIADKVEIVDGDARYFNLGKHYDFIFTSTGDFHHLMEREEKDSFLAKSFAHLGHEGALAIELISIPEDDFKRDDKKFLPERAPPHNMDLWKRNNVSYHSDKQILEIKEELHIEEDKEIKKSEYEIQLKLFSQEEMERILEDAGFINVKREEGSNFSPYLEEVDTWIAVAER